MSYQSYSTYTGPAPDNTSTPSGPIIREQSGTARVTINDGAATGSSNGTESIKTSEMSVFESGDWRQTAMTKSGWNTNEITAETLVTINGMQAPVSSFVASGILKKTAEGFEMAGSTQGDEQQQEHAVAASDATAMPQEIAMAVDNALEPFDDATVNIGLDMAISSVTGQIELADVVRKVVTNSGMDPSDAHQRVQFTINAYQSMTDNYISKHGIGQEDRETFYEFARQNRGELRGALTKMMHQQDMSGWKGMIGKFQNIHAPSIQALQTNGYQTRNTSKEPEVLIDGTWMSVKGAARSGLI